MFVLAAENLAKNLRDMNKPRQWLTKSCLTMMIYRKLIPTKTKLTQQVICSL